MWDKNCEVVGEDTGHGSETTLRASTRFFHKGGFA